LREIETNVETFQNLSEKIFKADGRRVGQEAARNGGNGLRSAGSRMEVSVLLSFIEGRHPTISMQNLSAQVKENLNAVYL
jgi:hypothetical protein